MGKCKSKVSRSGVSPDVPVSAGSWRCSYTLINGTPRVVDILARIANVKLWVPPTQRHTSASERPICLANSFCVIPRSFKMPSILSAISNDQSTRCLISCGVDAIISLKRSDVLLMGRNLLCQYLKSSNSDTSFVERLRGKTNFIVPINGEWVKREVAEIVHILQLAADALLHQWRKVYQFYCTVIESEFQDIVADILRRGNAQDKIVFHNKSIKRFDIKGDLRILKVVPVLKKLLFMQVEPFVYKRQNSSGQSSLDESILYKNDGLVVVVPHVEMRRIVVVNIHIDDNPVKFAYLWHNKSIFDLQRYNFFFELNPLVRFFTKNSI